MADEKKAICKSYKPANTIEEINLERRLLNHIIKQIADCCDYLIENKLLELLLPYTAKDQLVIRLDNVFQVNIMIFYFFILLYFHILLGTEHKIRRGAWLPFKFLFTVCVLSNM